MVHPLNQCVQGNLLKIPQDCEPEMSHILRWFLWWWLLMYIFVCGYAQVELVRSVDLHFCCVSGALRLL